MIVYLELLVNTNNHLLESPILTFLIAINSSQQIFEAFQLNYKSNKFNITDFRLHFNTLHILINSCMHIIHCTGLSMYIRINSGLLMNNNSLHININLRIDFNRDMKLNIYMRIHTGSINANLYQLTISLVFSRFEIIVNAFSSTW